MLKPLGAGYNRLDRECYSDGAASVATYGREVQMVLMSTWIEASQERYFSVSQFSVQFKDM